MTARYVRKLCEKREIERNTDSAPTLTKKQRDAVWKKTGGTCHLCGGRAGKKFHADHVKPRHLGGANTLKNYLPICKKCNGLRWCYEPKVIQLMMQIGVYAKNVIRNGKKGGLGDQLVQLVVRRTARNKKRRAKDKERRMRQNQP